MNPPPLLVALGSCFGAPNYFQELFSGFIVIPIYDYKSGMESISKITNNSVVMLGGGEDISPSLYDAKISKFSGAEIFPSTRDCIEQAAFNHAVGVGAKIYGICRGAQMVCALSGGTLFQDVTGHAGQDHLIRTVDGVIYNTSSVHHQMMNPEGTKHKLVAWSNEKRSRHYVIDDDTIKDEIEIEPEIVYFPETKALGVQGHPEFMPVTSAFVRYNSQLIKEYLLS
jgi:gamma-glutamyl-gamma-aminobutyrate hydrolase PuuD